MKLITLNVLFLISIKGMRMKAKRIHPVSVTEALSCAATFIFPITENGCMRPTAASRPPAVFPDLIFMKTAH